MMKSNRWWLFLVLLLVLGGYFLTTRQYNQAPIPRPFLQVDTARLQYIVVHSPKAKTAHKLIRKNEGWVLAYQDREYPAEPRIAQRILRKLKAFQPDQLVARKKAVWPRYGLQPGQAWRVDLLWMEDEERQVRTLYLGREDIRNKTQAITYVRRPDDLAVYAVPIYFGADLMENPRALTRNPDALE